MDTSQSETLKVFQDTQMYPILKNLCQILNADYPLNNFKLSSPFWKGDELSYDCFLKVLEDDYHTILNKKITRSKNSYINCGQETIKDIMYMLIEYIPDDKVESSIETRCVICLFNKSQVLLNCGHSPVCPKCYNVLLVRNIKTCPLCRQ
ncbi:Putative RING finger protein [Invertebrate iridescent virus 30]|uniref:Putative RING finger protein n=1 Tax=Invertebrate iridescent virus 30 TaxID=345585 RepID=W8W1R3_9VIRU|nr:Putative RING finger protein [Invertebrate iridescent virus 30]CCV02263.1 Putative RING finger protein [Invertebrate iridescent virus 30]